MLRLFLLCKANKWKAFVRNRDFDNDSEQNYAAARSLWFRCRQRGSSRRRPPHTRGPHAEPARRKRRGGIIPAYAGTTSRPAACAPRRWGHPRLRGDHARPVSMSCPSRGSSPHVRGPQPGAPRHPRGQRIIPACAGTTRAGCGMPSRSRDHPRMCGDHQKLLDLMRTFQGSSPHARGPRHVRAARHGLQGIIPACAETTRRARSTRPSTRDHPHTRGDHR